MNADDLELSVPNIDPDLSPMEAALAWADAGWYVGPLLNATKHPGSVLGKDWPSKTTRDPRVICDWFAGHLEGDRGAFVHVGRSGAVSLDVDNYDGLDAEVQAELERLEPPFQSTRSNDPTRGHYLLMQPVDRVIGNGGARHLGVGWGEVRGRNGVIVIAGAHEKADQGGRYEVVRSGVVPAAPAITDRLTTATDATDAVSEAQVEAFLDRHTAASRDGLLRAPLNALRAKFAAGHGRHPSTIDVLCWALCEAAAGFYSARTAVDTIEAMFWKAVEGEKRARDEFASMLAWAVAQAGLADPEETRRKVHERVGVVDATTNGAAGGGSSKEPTQATMLVDTAMADYDLHVSTSGMAFAIAREGPKLVRPLRGNHSLRMELSHGFYLANSKSPSSSALADALNTIEGAALASEPVPTYERVAEIDDAIIYDLGDSTGRAVRITADGWEIIAEPPVAFFRSKALAPQVAPERGGDIEVLRQFLNVDDATWPLLIAWLVAAFFPQVPRAILSFGGEQGTGKSTAARACVRLLDPSHAELRSTPTNIEDWAVAAKASYVVCLDNVSTLSGTISDALCRASTGDGLAKRSLYTDGDVAVLEFRRAVIFTSIAIGHLSGDLVDRMVSAELEIIDAADRREEAALWQAFEQERPLLLGALFDLLSQVLAIRDELVLDRLPRMADFGRIIAAVDAVRGTDGWTAYDTQANDSAEIVVLGDAVGQYLWPWLEARGSWSGTAGKLKELLEKEEVGLSAYGFPEFWPKNPRAMTSALTRLAPALRKLGASVTRGTGRDERNWIFDLRW